MYVPLDASAAAKTAIGQGHLESSDCIRGNHRGRRYSCRVQIEQQLGGYLGIVGVLKRGETMPAKLTDQAIATHDLARRTRRLALTLSDPADGTTASDDAPSHKADGGMLKGVRSIAADGQDTNVTRRALGAPTLLFYFESTEH